MAFDECTEYPADRKRAEESLRLTMAWAKRSLEHFKAHRESVVWRHQLNEDRVNEDRVNEDRVPLVPRIWGPGMEARTQSLFGIVQGGMYTELTLEMISEVLPLLPRDKPRYVMGVGYPDEIELYAKLGVDMMDCVLPTRAARHGLLFTSEGRLNIKNRQYAEDQNPPDPNCDCMVCRRYSRAYLRHLMHAGEALSGTLNSIHNLAYYLGIMERVRKELAAQNPG
jgi:queuine tRNA-ribosyltransferase